ncbi:hypothetical protein LCGC14_0498620 [marine sediment metagenome]|uniref:Uncharacterized protein n=1 Tax=marine sediment metagenome TaxID=412755 RepID=A0A0F9VD77_9ZZZZ
MDETTYEVPRKVDFWQLLLWYFFILEQEKRLQRVLRDRTYA